MHLYLRTERLVLRRFTVEDLDALVDLDADPEVMRYINGGRPTPRAELRDDVLPFWLGYYERGEPWGFWAAIDRASGAFLGWFHLRPRRDVPADQLELGFRLRRQAWNMGLATEGFAGVDRQGVRRAWSEPGLRHDDGYQHRIAPRHGKERDAPCPAVPRRVA